MSKDTQITTFNRFTRVSRETIISLKKYEYLLINANKNLNLVGKSTINDIWVRRSDGTNEKWKIDKYGMISFDGLTNKFNISVLSKDEKITKTNELRVFCLINDRIANNTLPPPKNIS